ncbi:MAG TPA: hypothetical protein VFE78_05880, partial [Gemmataceae bacterium]|nr:hypothetical protein [Gemmataceae bacterium]
MLESELYDRENSDNAGGGRAAGELNAPAPSVPAAVFQPPPVVFQPPAIRPEPAPVTTQPRVSTRPAGPPADTAGLPASAADAAGPPANGDAAGDGGADDDGTGTARRRRRRPSRSRTRTDGTADAGDTPAAQDADAPRPDAEAAQDQPEPSRSRSSRTRTRRPSAAQDPAGQQAAEGSAEPAEDGGPEDDADSADRRDGETAAGRRRRRKRRRGSADGPELSADDPPDTVVHVREPTGPAGPTSNDDVRSVKGSTRLEAKKQRRREGRETGRRRPPIITESEFLARRESVERTMVVRQRKDRTQIAVLEDGVLVEHYVNRSTHQSYVGNVYLGKVQNVLPSMEAAFVDVGKGRNAV